MIAGGIGATSFQNLGLTIAAERERGTLKRLRGTPMPPAAYFIGKIIQVFVCTVAEVVVLVAVGMAFYHLHLPTSGGQVVDAGLGLRPRHRRLLADRHRHQQPVEFRDELVPGDHAAVPGAPVHLRRLRAVQ